jgi:hypothetical protein
MANAPAARFDTTRASARARLASLVFGEQPGWPSVLRAATGRLRRRQSCDRWSIEHTWRPLR